MAIIDFSGPIVGGQGAIIPWEAQASCRRTLIDGGARQGPVILPSFLPSAIPSFRHSRLTRHSCLLLFRPSVIPARLPSFLPSVIPAFRRSPLPSFPPSVVPRSRHCRLPLFPLPSLPPSVIPPSRRSHLPSFPRKRESKVVRPMPAFLSQRSLDSRFRGNDGRRWNDGRGERREGGTMRANPENEKAPRGPPTGIDDASQRHIMSGNPPDT